MFTALYPDNQAQDNFVVPALAADLLVQVEQEEKSGERTSLTLAHQLSSLLQMPTPANYIIGEGKFRDERKMQRKNYRRNFIQKNLQYIYCGASSAINQSDQIQKCLEILSKQQHVHLSYVCSTVQEFWQLYCKFGELKVCDSFLNKWRS
jgi:hypothetical protein